MTKAKKNLAEENKHEILSQTNPQFKYISLKTTYTVHIFKITRTKTNLQANN